MENSDGLSGSRWSQAVWDRSAGLGVLKTDSEKFGYLINQPTADVIVSQEANYNKV